MVVVGRIKRGAYFDSVALMTVGRDVSTRAGVVDAGVVMGTAENRSILDSSGLLLPEFAEAGDSDLLIAVKAEDESAAEAAVVAVLEQLERGAASTGGDAAYAPSSIDGAVALMPDANLALISVAGRYAAREAWKALRGGLHVMLFSDNVSVASEIELKTYAHEHGLIVMGPDCGTAILSGTPLGFANAVRPGAIGIVAASGTGLQEISSIVSNEGEGVSQAIGTGGRDVTDEVGGVTFLDALDALAEDPETRVLALVSKPPDPRVLDRIETRVAKLDIPVVTIFIGADSTGPSSAATLEEAALRAVALVRGEDAAGVGERLAGRAAELERLAEEWAGRIAPGRRFVRGLLSGGTFCAEAQMVLRGIEGGLSSNVPLSGVRKLADPLVSEGHTLVDLGADEFTVGRPHPMIDYTLRVKRLETEAADPETAVVLLDVVLGYGSHPDPASELTGVIGRAAGSVAVVCSVTGTDRDPQNRNTVEAALRAAGAVVASSNAAACLLARKIAERCRE